MAALKPRGTSTSRQRDTSSPTAIRPTSQSDMPSIVEATFFPSSQHGLECNKRHRLGMRNYADSNKSRRACLDHRIGDLDLRWGASVLRPGLPVMLSRLWSVFF